MTPGSFQGGGIPQLNQITMGYLETLGTILFVWVLSVALAGLLARRRGRDEGVWAVLGIFVGPLAVVAILLLPRRAPRPDSEVGRLEAEAPEHVRLVDDSHLELNVAGRLARLRGEIAARINGRPSFHLAGSTDWQWSDGTPMTDAERAQLRRDVPQIGRHDGWVLTLDARDRDRGASS